MRGWFVRSAARRNILRMLAIARLFLEQHSISAKQFLGDDGPEGGAVAMFFGANDMGSVMMEENVVLCCWATYRLNERQICRLHPRRGWVPGRRDQYYNVLHRHDAAHLLDSQFPPKSIPRFAPSARLHNQRLMPGLDDGSDRSAKVQLPILGGQ